MPAQAAAPFACVHEHACSARQTALLVIQMTAAFPGAEKQHSGRQLTHLGDLLGRPLHAQLLSRQLLLLPLPPGCALVFLQQTSQRPISVFCGACKRAQQPQRETSSKASSVCIRTPTLALCLSFAYCSDRTCLLAIPLVSCPTVGAASLLSSLFRFFSPFCCILPPSADDVAERPVV